ncbi:MAG TPA: patatin-like phospholipase family protein [Candidatus Eisenbacteria bacterium]|jgi:predicted acylesterase/phospholipase RssA
MRSSEPTQTGAAQNPSGVGSGSPVRLGLALSGGGFRATLFHLGVLVRLAELDLLRHLHVISSVSGGSILAAHYMLRLKAALEGSATGRLSREEYVRLVARVRSEIRQAVAAQLRCRLLDRPLELFRMMFLGRTRWRLSLSEKMASLYQRHLFQQATRELPGASAGDVAGGMPLCRMHVRLPELLREPDIERYNACATTDRVPKLVLNASTLNTGCKFTFTFSEIGDEMLGYIRCDERALLRGYKLLLQRATPATDAGGAVGRGGAGRGGPGVAGAGPALRRGDLAEDGGAGRFELRRFTSEHLTWWHAANAERASRQELPGRASAIVERARRAKLGETATGLDTFRSAAVRHLVESWDGSLRFLDAQPGALRAAKVAAWYALDRAGWSGGVPPETERRGGFTLAEHRERFWRALRAIDPSIGAVAGPGSSGGVGEREAEWMEFVLELYYFRVASALRAGALDAITLPTAVQASANFPPVFSPLHLRGLFDGEKVDRLRLSDGGLDDNNGIESVMDERCTHVIASEAGPGPQMTRDVGWNRLGMMIQIVFNQLVIVRRLELRALREQARVHRALAELAANAPAAPAPPGIADLRRRYPVEAVAFFLTDSSLGDGVPETDSPPPLPAHPLAREVSGLRIDLDGFSDIEQDTLVYQGYQYADRFVRRYVYPSLAAAGLVPAVPPPPASPVTLPGTEAEWDHAQRVLAAGAAMFGRAWKLGGAWRGAYAGAVAALLAVEACAAWFAWESLAWLVRTPAIPPALSSVWRSSLGGLVLSLLFCWVTFVLFGSWVRIDGQLAEWASRSGPSRGHRAPRSSPGLRDPRREGRSAAAAGRGAFE